MIPENSIPTARLADLASFKNAELTSVTVWKFAVSLGFNNGPLVITVENNAEFQSHGRAEAYNQEIIVGFGARVLVLIGQRVVDVVATEDRTLALRFDDGSTLTLRPDSSGFESYSVNFPDGSLFVG